MRTLLTLALALSTLSLAAQTPKKAEPAKPATKAEPAKPAAKPAATAFVGNKDSKIIHKTDCKMAAKMKADKKQDFATKAEAEKAGFKACKVCKP